MATAGPTRTEDDPAAGRDAWLRTRTYLNAHRHELTDAALRHFKPEDFIPGTRLLARQGWIPDHPVPLEDVQLAFHLDGQRAEATTTPFRAQLVPHT